MSTTSAHEPPTSLTGEPVAVRSNGDHGDDEAADGGYTAAHGFLFQHHTAFAGDVNEFLDI